MRKKIKYRPVYKRGGAGRTRRENVRRKQTKERDTQRVQCDDV